ncbi:Periplasmic glucans biosynthesis protein [Ruegeria denitrificans]|uniref:Periplasmic glucans biosynthesis protein n=1 Tax=Ruegeria denitrificans TaxID=1715692 RepID=A0A0P1I9F7_9RHOB|nr:Periplasmic glucans biosynthesis protein [Ruegeria denitrificans]
MTKSDDNLMDPTKRLNDAPRCTATAKSSGMRCRAPAVRGWSVCRMHGARGGHAAGSSHPSWKHGERSRSTERTRKTISELIRADKELQKLIN